MLQFRDQRKACPDIRDGKASGRHRVCGGLRVRGRGGYAGLARKRGEDPFLFLLDNIEDPHNLGAIIRTANLAGAHGVIIPKRRAVGLTATVAKTIAGALNYTPVAKVTNLAKTMEELKEKGLWFVCADMGGESMYRLEPHRPHRPGDRQ